MNTNRAYVVSLIGRPNVGKSSIFNCLVGKGQKAITYDMPGVTRDRHYDFLSLDELGGAPQIDCILVDTGGFYPAMKCESVDHTDKAQVFFKAMVEQGEEAIRESDLVLLVVDVREGLLPYDEMIVRYLREQQKPFWLVVNKYDHDNLETSIYDFYKLGIDEECLFKISASHGRGLQHLREELQRQGLKFFEGRDQSNELGKGITPREQVVGRVAIVGLPNAGKSTLLNALVGMKRALVSDIAGTTVDPIEAYFDLFFGEKAALIEESKQNYGMNLLFQEYEMFRQNNPDMYRKMEEFEEGGTLETPGELIEDSGDEDCEEESPEVSPARAQEIYKTLFDEPILDESSTLESEEVTEQNYWRSVHLVDTAGIRQKANIDEEIEEQSVFRALRCITECDIVIYLIDTSKGLSHQDRHLIALSLEKGKSVILGLNKFDLVLKKYRGAKERREYLETLTCTIPWISYCDVIPLTAIHKRGLGRLRQSLVRTFLSRKVKIPTGELNRAFLELCDKHPAHLKGKAELKIKYATMVKGNPPTILLFVNRSRGISEQYKRYLKNGLREMFRIRNTPVHLLFRSSTDLSKRLREVTPSKESGHTVSP
ncbi:MAG: 50S ribosome-binding GTPase [Bdellovibrio sp.]|nr:50S ribosome-binding GTPase [Bdellovibrio sp.]